MSQSTVRRYQNIQPDVMGYSGSIQINAKSDSSSENCKESITRHLRWKGRLFAKHPGIVPYYILITSYVILFTMFLATLAPYWGAFYGAQNRLNNLKILVVSEDQVLINGLSPLVGQAIQATADMSVIQAVGGFQVVSPQKLLENAPNNNSVEQEVYRQVHHQNFWGAIWVKSDATASLYNAFSIANSSYDPAGQLIEAIYETGRDMASVGAFIVPAMDSFEAAFLANVSASIYAPLINLLTNQQKEDIISGNALQLISSQPLFRLIDNRPALSSQVIGSSQVGLIHTYIISLQHFNYALRFHTYIRTQLKTSHFIFFRLASSQLTYVVLSFVYCLAVLAFQISVTVGFGHSGFLVLWSIMFLEMSAIGGINECVSLIIYAIDNSWSSYWTVFFLVINVAPVFNPIPLSAKFFRFGYAMPIYNAYEALKPIYFNTYKGRMGRYIGILLAWIFLSNLLLPFAMKWASKKGAQNFEVRKAKLCREVSQAVKDEESE